MTASTLGQGNVYINNQDKSLLTFTGSSAGSFNITTAGGITASSITTSVGDINLSAHGASNVSGLTSIGNIVVNDTAGLLTLSTSTAANSITATSTGGVSILGTTGLTASQGAINITANAASKITSSSQSFGDFTIDDTKGVLTITAATIDSTSGSVGITGAGGATVAGLTSAGNLSINGGTKTVASNVTSTSGEVTIVSPGAATLSDINGSTGISITDSKTTTATTLQTANGPIAVVSNGPGTVSLSGVQTTNGGNINVTTGGTTTLKDFTAVGAVTATTGGATTVGSITTTGSAGDGDISITNATGTLQTSASAQVFAVNGNISLQNNNLKSGSVVIGLGSEIETGTLPSSGTGGNITFTIGTAPTPAASPAQQGTAPSPTLVTPTTSGTGVIDWGTGISAVNNKAGANTVSAINAYVNFNTGGLKPTAIKLDGDTTIIADPPSSTHVVTPAFNEANAVSTGPAPSGSLQPTLQAAGAVASEPLLEPVLPAGQTTSPSGLGTIPSITANAHGEH